jgi:hypothetical protein
LEAITKIIVTEDEVFSVCYKHKDIVVYKWDYVKLDSWKPYSSVQRDMSMNGIVIYELKFGNMHAKHVKFSDGFINYVKTGSTQKIDVDIFYHICEDYYYTLGENFNYIPDEYTYKAVCDILYNSADIYLSKLPRDIIGVIKIYL